MYCRKCGKQLENWQKFCTGCGQEIPADQQVYTQNAPQSISQGISEPVAAAGNKNRVLKIAVIVEAVLVLASGTFLLGLYLSNM